MKCGRKAGGKSEKLEIVKVYYLRIQRMVPMKIKTRDCEEAFILSLHKCLRRAL